MTERINQIAGLVPVGGLGWLGWSYLSEYQGEIETMVSIVVMLCVVASTIIQYKTRKKK